MKKVLVVDDSEFMGKLVECFLQKRGWEVEMCSGPFGVMNKVKEYRPNLILMDLKMPGLSGSKLATLLRKHREADNIKVLSFSSEDERVQKELVETGVIDGYFVKGSSFSGLCEEMERVLSKVENA